MIYTPKQRALMKLWQTNSLKRINLLEGSVSSGKTWISLVLWAFWVKTMPDDKLYMMCAKSLTTLKRNCLLPLQELVGVDNFTFNMTSKEGKLFGRKILLEGANDMRSESKIRGITLQGAYCDELTLFPKDFFTMLLSRLRVEGAKLIATTNPDSPAHWLKTEYIDRQDELSMLDVKFLLDDNTTLPQDYVENLKKEYTGIFYDRFIMGAWVLAEGLIFPMYQEAIQEPPEDWKNRATKMYLSIDYGTLNAFAALLWAYVDGVWYAVDSYYYSGREKGNTLTDEQYGDEIDKHFGEYGNEYSKLKVIVDPSAASFIAELRRRKRYSVIKANNDVLDGIRATASAMNQGLIKISPKIKEFPMEAASYVWADTEGVDAPVKENDHCVTGDTLVMTENGEKPIKDLVGTTGKVWSFNTKTHKLELKHYHNCRCTQKKAELCIIITTYGGLKLKCTADHLILTTRGYIEAMAASHHSLIVAVDGKITLDNVEQVYVTYNQDVYNMEVEDNHNFVVNGGLIVHNCLDSIRYMVYTLNIVRKKGK